MKNFWKTVFIPILILALLLSLGSCGLVRRRSATGGDPDPSAAPVRYGYTTLTPREQHVYSMLVGGIARPDPQATILIGAVDAEEVSHAFEIFLSDYPECFWVQNSYRTRSIGSTVLAIQPHYTVSAEALTEASAALEQALSEILAGLPDASDPYRQALYLHDVLLSRVTYEENTHDQTAYGALVLGRAVCVGYAAAYQLLLRRAGIPSWRISGTAVRTDLGIDTPVSHAWNAVWPDAETCIYVDPTWNDSRDSNTIWHGYFGLSATAIAQNHTPKAHFLLPDIESTGYSYYERIGASINDSSTHLDVAALLGPVTNGARTATFLYEGSKPFAEWLSMNGYQLVKYAGVPLWLDAYGVDYEQRGKEILLTVHSQGEFSYHVSVRLMLDSYYTVLCAWVLAPCEAIDRYVEPDPQWNLTTKHIQTTTLNGVTLTPTVQNGRIVGVTITGVPVGDAIFTFPFPSEFD